MGDTDIDTMTNVTLGKYNFDDDAFKIVSDSAKEFIRLLLQKDGRWMLLLFFTYTHQMAGFKSMCNTNFYSQQTIDRTERIKTSMVD